MKTFLILLTGFMILLTPVWIILAILLIAGPFSFWANVALIAAGLLWIVIAFFAFKFIINIVGRAQ